MKKFLILLCLLLISNLTLAEELNTSNFFTYETTPLTNKNFPVNFKYFSSYASKILNKVTTKNSNVKYFSNCNCISERFFIKQDGKIQYFTDALEEKSKEQKTFQKFLLKNLPSKFDKNMENKWYTVDILIQYKNNIKENEIFIYGANTPRVDELLCIEIYINSKYKNIDKNSCEKMNLIWDNSNNFCILPHKFNASTN